MPPDGEIPRIQKTSSLVVDGLIRFHMVNDHRSVWSLVAEDVDCHEFTAFEGFKLKLAFFEVARLVSGRVSRV